MTKMKRGTGLNQNLWRSSSIIGKHKTWLLGGLTKLVGMSEAYNSLVTSLYAKTWSTYNNNKNITLKLHTFII